MAVVNTKATAVSNADSKPPKQSPLHISHGREYVDCGTVEVASGDSIGSTYRMARVWSGDRISGLELFNDALGAAVTGDVGIYETADNGGAAVDADVFATLVDLNTARSASPLLALFEALNIDKIEKKLWEVLGKTEDPQRWYDVAITLAGAAAGSAGTLSLQVRSVGNA